MKKNIVSIILLIVITFSIVLSGCVDLFSKDEQNTNPVIIEGRGGFLSIQEAIDAAYDNDTIYVKNGIYFENLLINKSIKLIGEESNKTILTYNESINGENKTELIQIIADNCTIEEFTISLNKNISNSNMIGIKISNSYNIITKNIITNMLQGIVIMNGKNNTISENIISDNNQYGICLSTASNNKILLNNIQSTKQYGMYVSTGSNNNLIKRNIFSNNGYGIRLKGCDNEIVRNRIINTTQIGLYFCCGANNNIAYNNSLEKNFQHANDAFSNTWSYYGYGNYWDDYMEKYPNAKQINGFWSIPYDIIGEKNKDGFPHIEPISI
jgi:parallel beta-helix repeat protein